MLAPPLRCVLTQKLVEWSIQQADGHWQGRHGDHHRFQILALGRSERFQRLSLSVGRCGQQERSNQWQTVAEEHVLGSAQTDSFGAEFSGPHGVLGPIGVGPHPYSLAPHFIGPTQ